MSLAPPVKRVDVRLHQERPALRTKAMSSNKAAPFRPEDSTVVLVWWIIEARRRSSLAANANFWRGAPKNIVVARSAEKRFLPALCPTLPFLNPLPRERQKRSGVSIKHLPLSAYPSFRAHTVDSLCESVECELGAMIVEMAKSTPLIAASANRYKLPSSDLWFCDYGLPIRLRFSETDDLRIQFQRTGVGATRVGQHLIPVTAAQSCIASAKADVDFGSDYQQVAWRLPRVILKQKLVFLTGKPVIHGLEFDPVLDMTTPQSTAFRKILESLLQNIDISLPGSSKLVLPELENALVVSFLCTARHNFRDVLDRPVRSAAPWQVRRTESYIEANWNEPLTLEDIVAATGVSARSVFRAFKKSRGYTPFQFAKQLRLQHARRLLDRADPVLTVTEVAVACGFENLSRFSKDFSLAFGEPPSAVRNRRRSARS